LTLLSFFVRQKFLASAVTWLLSNTKWYLSIYSSCNMVCIVLLFRFWFTNDFVACIAFRESHHFGGCRLLEFTLRFDFLFTFFIPYFDFSLVLNSLLPLIIILVVIHMMSWKCTLFMTLNGRRRSNCCGIGFGLSVSFVFFSV
jgi:hypothetical protein